jgi:hypothetical protein
MSWRRLEFDIGKLLPRDFVSPASFLVVVDAREKFKGWTEQQPER